MANPLDVFRADALTGRVALITGGGTGICRGIAAAYAKLGGAVSLYARASGLMAKYYSLQAELDDNLNVTGIGNQKALQESLGLAQSQVERSVSVLQDKGVDPTLVVAGYESAGIDREGDPDDKLNALTSYWTGFVESRVLAYLGGFPTEGYE